MNVCRAPITEQEFEQYYHLRWQVLRQPWQQPVGSERDTIEQTCIHRMIIDENNTVLAVGRLEKVNQFTGKITDAVGDIKGTRPKAAIIREKGSNSEREICLLYTSPSPRDS